MRTFQIKVTRRCIGHASPGFVALCFICFFTIPSVCSGQVTFASAIRLALRNSSRIRGAELDLRKAQQSLAIAKDIFAPSVVAGGGLGWTYGITLTVPTIFTINAQSLVYSNQQRFAIRAAHADIDAARFALAEARQQTEEDVAMTCIALEESQKSLAALSQQREFAGKLVSILEDRVHAGLDSDLDLKKARRSELQIELKKMEAEDDRATLVAHLADLTGSPGGELNLVADSIPSIPDANVSTASSEQESFSTPGLLSVEASARGKLERAKGKAGYTWRPIIDFAAQYGRVSQINNVTSFYNLHGNYNTANIGVQFSFPIFDKVRKDAARISMADAVRSEIDVRNQQTEETSNRIKLQRSVRQAAVRSEMAELDYSIAQDELKSTTIQLRSTAGSPALTPKEEQNAKLQEREKYLDLLEARLQLDKARVSLLRQTGQLERWVDSVAGASVAH